MAKICCVAARDEEFPFVGHLVNGAGRDGPCAATIHPVTVERVFEKLKIRVSSGGSHKYRPAPWMEAAGGG